MYKRELFSGQHIEAHSRTPERPLASTSDFVVMELPKLVTALEVGKLTAEGLSEKIGAVIDTIDNATTASLLEVGRVTQSLDLATYDLKILETALVTYDQPIPEKLFTLVTQFSAAVDQPAMLTYEELIFINPERDHRSFTDGVVGNAEHDFYFGHRRIEHDLATILRRIESAARHLAGQRAPFTTDYMIYSIDLACAELDLAIEQFSSVMTTLQEVGLKMRTEDFAGFRKFFNTHPVRNLKAPSGAFTSAIPTIDLRLGGENLPEAFIEYLTENLQYYPRFGRVEITTAMQKMSEGKSLAALAARRGNPPELLDRLQKLSDILRYFRGLHFKGVRNQIPLALKGELSGTGGETDVSRFLRDRMKLEHVPKSS